MFVSRLNNMSYDKYKKEDKMREASNMLKYMYSQRDSSEDYIKANFQHSKPILNSRKINDLLLNGLTFTSKDSDSKCLIEADSIRPKYKPRPSGKKNTLVFNRPSMTAHQGKRKERRVLLTDERIKSSANSFILKPSDRSKDSPYCSQLGMKLPLQNQSYSLANNTYMYNIKEKFKTVKKPSTS
mmetsp:Transcript_31441/g.27802  ORF Transcript_31441/g.27802 Transcript_31441/m.27802 type:complete len:184 (+) Transcript_31441:150-701(+)